jgi:hypothetical protein
VIELPDSGYTLALLLDYLVAEKKISPKFLRLKMKHDESQDALNQTDPRAFCHVFQDRMIVYSTLALERLPADARTGVLLHEIAHLHLNAFNGADSEVDVDEWCMFDVPESNYHYRDCFYVSPWTGAGVTARNLEHVKNDFLARLG